MALADIWMIDFTQRYGSGGELMHNNFFYTSLDAGANAEGLAIGFSAEDALLEKINDTQNPLIKNDGVRIINLGLLTDFYTEPLSGEGLRPAGECLPPFNAVNYTLKLNTRAVRPGSKRIAGVGESVQQNGLITDGDMITAIGALEIELSDTLSDGTHSYNPIVIKRVGLPTPGTPPYTSYRLPIDDSELVYGVVTAVVVNLVVSHQVSRGNGR